MNKNISFHGEYLIEVRIAAMGIRHHNDVQFLSGLNFLLYSLISLIVIRFHDDQPLSVFFYKLLFDILKVAMHINLYCRKEEFFVKLNRGLCKKLLIFACILYGRIRGSESITIIRIR